MTALAPYAELLGTVATAYGVVGACSSLLQARRLAGTGSAESVSLAFLSIYVGGYIVWGLYGLAINSVPLIAVDLAGSLASALTLTLAVRIHYRARLARARPNPPVVGGRAAVARSGRNADP
jgi:uncharacterized protein with PQ loop repeat